MLWLVMHILLSDGSLVVAARSGFSISCCSKNLRISWSLSCTPLQFYCIGSSGESLGRQTGCAGDRACICGAAVGEAISEDVGCVDGEMGRQRGAMYVPVCSPRLSGGVYIK